MKFYKLLLLWMTVAVAALAIACGDDDDEPAGDATPEPTTAAATATPDAAAGGFPLTVTDDNGNDLTLSEKPERIVALAPSFVEVLFALGEGDSIVAADSNTDSPPEAQSIPKISGFDPSVEGIASYEPDLVLIFYDPGGLEEALEALGIPTAYLATPADLEGVYTQIELLGVMTGRTEEAAAVIDEMKAGIAQIVSQLADVEDGPSVFHELDAQLFTVGPGSFMDEVYTLLKAENIAGPTGEAYPQMSAEAVIAANPDVIILADGDFGESPETVAARPGWDAVSAVQNNRVYPVPGALLSRASPRIVDDIETLAALLYPERF